MRVVVTGCSSGIGLETAILLGRRGDQVVAGVRTVDGADWRYPLLLRVVK